MISLSGSGILKEVSRGSFKLVQSTYKIEWVVVSSSRSGVYLEVLDYEEEVFVPLEYSLFSLKRDRVKVVLFKKKRLLIPSGLLFFLTPQCLIASPKRSNLLINTPVGWDPPFNKNYFLITLITASRGKIVS